ncbi:hypothetical protein [Actinoallomurus sp. NPDC052274]|uniref:hypothetical protein n=1 Tax=Actinoallomurus sp. NPDC052274 TaxID=3155420 RepID=UPI0034246A4B
MSLKGCIAKIGDVSRKLGDASRVNSAIRAAEQKVFFDDVAEQTRGTKEKLSTLWGKKPQRVDG